MSTSLVVLFKVQLTGNLSKGRGGSDRSRAVFPVELGVWQFSAATCASRVSVALGNLDTG